MNQSKKLPSNQIKISDDALSSLIENMAPEITLCGYQKKDPLAVCDTRVLSENELIYVFSGTLIVTISDTVYTLCAQTCILIPAFYPHKISVDKNNLPSNYWVHFTCKNSVCSHDFFEQFYHVNKSFAIPVKEPASLLKMCSDLLMHAFSKESGSAVLSQAYFQILLTEILKTEITDYTLFKPNDIADELFYSLYTYARKEFLNIHTVTDLARPFNISTSYCSRLFRIHAKTSPMKFVMLEKLKYSEHLLQNDYPVTKIAEMLNFSSPYHFSNIFKQYYSMSPTEYKSRRYDL